MSRTADPTAKISLLRAAEAVFAEHGLASAKVEEITRRAGLSKGAFYLHFDGKEEAFKQVVESFLARVAGIYVPPSACSDLPDTPEGIVAYWLERDVQCFSFLWQNRAIVAILAGCQGPYTYLLETFRTVLHATSKEWIEFSKQQNLIREEIDTELLATLLCGAYDQLFMKMLALPKKPPIADWLGQALSVFLRGMGTAQVIEGLHEDASLRAHRDPPVTNASATTLVRTTAATTGRVPAEKQKRARS